MLAIFSTTKNSSRKRNLFTQEGTSLVEMILYVVILVFVMGIIVQTLISISGVYREIKLTREVESSGTIAMESMLREIRNASAVAVGESTLGTSPGTITISGTDEDLNDYEIEFDTSSGVLQVSKNSEPPTAVTSLPVTVSYLLFTRVTSMNSEAIRIELEVSGTAGSISESKKFYGFAILRGSY